MFSRAVVFLIALLVIHGVCAAGAPIPPDIKKVVSFVYVKSPKGDIVPNGTGFFVGIPSETDKNSQFGYLVTARHVLLGPDGKPYPTIWVRLNRLDGGSDTVEFDVEKAKTTRVLFHSDPDVDLAAIMWAPDLKIYDYKQVTLDFLPEEGDIQKLGIAEGTDVFFAGLFTSHLGQKRNCPIVRFGRVAMLPDEKVAWGKKPDGTDDLRVLYLLETQSYGGNSGAPVFFYLGADRAVGSIYAGPPVIKLAGVMMGSFNDLKPIQAVENSVRALVSTGNMGVAAVTPSYLLRAMLLSETAQQQRIAAEHAATSRSE